MTDNRTTELTAMERFRTALEKRGIEFETNDDECAEGEERTTLFKANLGEGEFDIFVMAKDWYFDGKLTPWLDVEFHNTLTPEQAIAATLGSDQEANLGDALNEVAEKWAIAHVEAEDYAKRCMLLEELVRDAYWLIVRAIWSHESQDKFAADWTERMSVLGIEVD